MSTSHNESCAEHSGRQTCQVPHSGTARGCSRYGKRFTLTWGSKGSFHLPSLLEMGGSLRGGLLMLALARTSCSPGWPPSRYSIVVVYITDYNYIAIGEGGLELLGLLSAGNIRELPYPVCVVLGMEPSALSLLGERSIHSSSPRGVLLTTYQGLFV